MKENNDEARKLFDEFQNTWNLENVKNMTLEEYTGIKSSGERNDFTYWIEKKLENLGSIWGGSSFKFGVYKRDSTEAKEQDKGRVYNENYAWLEKYGSTPEKAFEKVKSLIIQVIEYSQKNELTKIDEIDLGHAYKWKIAFHYQNPDDMKMFCIFQQNTLKRIAENELGNGNLPTSQIYIKLMSNKKYTLEDSCNERSIPLWGKYSTNDDSYDENSQPDINKNKGDSMQTIPPLNQILYGPPGTGKTYSTIDKALEILRHYEMIEKIPESREDKRAIFDEYRANKQIEFVTFHQSFSYEEFVEGIKPKFVKKSKNSSNETETKSKEMVYKIKSGIFKKICKKALKNCDSSNKITLQKIQERIKSNPYVWKVSLEQTDSELYKYCLKNNEIRIGFQHDGGDKNASVRHFRDEMQKGDIVGIRHDDQSFNAIGVIVGDCDEKNIDERATITKTYPITRKIKWILIDNVKNIQNKKLDRNAVYQLNTTTKDLFEKIQDRAGYTFDDLPNQITCKDLPKKPYILIIDEVNRGNISKILGELITLIEPSKRIGASDEEKARGIGDESLEVTLPYSNETFGVPSNLYIIGTMNTADRSIALLDTALRRRFEFVEMMPNCKELQKIWLVGNDEDYEDSSIDEWNANEAKVLYEILTAINNRIEFLLDREHTIGHAFFFEKAIKKDGYFVLSLDSLKEIFAKKIIPLLQEYFYDDYAKIDAVLGGNEMVEIIETKASKLFPKKDADLDLEDKKIYKIKPFDDKIWNNPQTYINIYYNETTKPQSQDSNKSDAK